MKYPNIRADRGEEVLYDRADYPVYVRLGRLSSYPRYSAEEHWHDDLEFILILSGEMTYNVNGEKILLSEGEGIFVNSRQLHFGYSESCEECVFICILVHPMLLCSSQSVERKYIAPIIYDGGTAFLHVAGKSDWEMSILGAIRSIYDARDGDGAELVIQKNLFEIWIGLYGHVRQSGVSEGRSHKLSVLKAAISYVGTHYKERLTLDDVARAGNISRTGCCELFKGYLNKTPIEYLTQYRLRKGAELLVKTDMTVLEISLEVGFSGASYFTETFRRLYGSTPSEYRKAHGSEDIKQGNRGT